MLTQAQRKKSNPHAEGTIEIPLQEPKEAFSDTYYQLVNATVADALKKDDTLCRAPEVEIWLHCLFPPSSMIMGR